MRTVSVTLFITAILAVGTPIRGRAQTTSHTTKAKSSTADKTHRPAAVAHGTSAAKFTPAASHARAAAAVPAAPVASAGDVTALVPVSGATLRDAPDGQPFATLSPRMTLEPVAHDKGWVRVRTEGWVKETDVAPVDSTHSVLTAADLRADPEGSRGKHVRWDVEVLAMATADPLRKGLNPDEPYLLVRGPGSESALLYVAIPPRMLADARSLASLAPVAVTIAATVRVGRSEPVGIPILDAQSLARR
jgi:hypothetical protein